MIDQLQESTTTVYPDGVLAEAVKAGVLLSSDDADLIICTRLRGLALTKLAGRLGVAYSTLWRRRSIAERQLATVLREPDFPDHEETAA